MPAYAITVRRTIHEEGVLHMEADSQENLRRYMEGWLDQATGDPAAFFDQAEVSVEDVDYDSAEDIDVFPTDNPTILKVEAQPDWEGVS